MGRVEELDRGKKKLVLNSADIALDSGTNATVGLDHALKSADVIVVYGLDLRFLIESQRRRVDRIQHGTQAFDALFQERASGFNSIDSGYAIGGLTLGNNESGIEKQ